MFMCQRDSFLRELETEIVSCDEFDDIKSLGLDPKVVPGPIYKLVLKDTVLFPEGGGQPDDHGTISSASVVRVLRNGTIAEHYVTSKLSPGDKVTAKIDWERRFDHMQQHSGQHLITAVADTLFGAPTTSWWLGSEESYIELDIKELSQDQIQTIEDEVNRKIREAVSVDVDVVSLDDPKLSQARGRNLPEDVKGNIRIVTMKGIESNVCCGTHVTNLSQLQVVKLLQAIKKKGKILLHFLVGNRVISKFSQMSQREQQLVEIIKSNSTELPSAAEKLNAALKNARKSSQTLSKELAGLVAKEFKCMSPPPKLWMYHKDNVDLDFGLALLRELGDSKNLSIVFITGKTEGNSGFFLLASSESLKDQLVTWGQEISSILDGKGSLQRGCIFQAKVSKMNGLNKAQKCLENFTKDS